MLFLILDLVHDFWRFFSVLFVLWSVGRLWLYQCKQTPFKLHKHIPSLATIKWQCEPFLDSRIWMMMMMTILLFPFSFYCSISSRATTINQYQYTVRKTKSSSSTSSFCRLCWPFTFHFSSFFPFCSLVFFFSSFLSVRFPYMHYQTRHTTAKLTPKHWVVEWESHINSLRRGRQKRFSLLTAYRRDDYKRCDEYIQWNNNEAESEAMKWMGEEEWVSERREKKRNKAYGQCLYASHWYMEIEGIETTARQ